MTVKVKVGQSKNIRLVAAGEKRPVIVPDSITLGIDTVGEYVARIDGGAGIVVTPENNVESANLVISHAITTTEVSSNNSVFEFIRNASIDQFGHITSLVSTGLDANNFITANNVISTKQITFGNTAIALGGSTSEFRNLDLIEVGNFTISANTISAPGDINFDIVNSDSVINAGIHRIINVEDPVNSQDVVNLRFLEVELDRVENTVKVVNDPVLPTDGANKRYVDGLVQGLIVRPSALAATTADLGGVFESGNTTVASTITLDPVQFLYIDDVTTWDLYSNLLVKDQINPEENGSYDLIQIGSANTAWVFQRTVWSNESSEIPGSYEFVTKGTVNGGTGWVATVTDASNFRIDLDDVVWTQFSGEGTFTAGSGLTLDNRQFNVNVDNSSIEIFGNNLRVKDAGITNAKLQNSQIAFGLTTVNLGSTSNVIEGLTRLGVGQISGLNNFLTVQANTVFIDGSGGIIIPAGTTLERSAAVQGTIRYNISDGQFEGYDGIAWSGLGGVIDVNQDTKITAENSPGANNDELKFFTGGTLAAKIDSANNAFFYGSVDIAGDVTIGGNIRIGNQDVDTVTVVADFTSNLIPDVDRTYNLGSELKNWNYVYIDTLRSSDEVINLDISGALKLPSANTALRPVATTGMIRFNTEDGQFEGYDGIAWSGLGGVIDVNQDTKITAENSPGSNNDELKFFANGALSAMFDQTDAYFYGNVEVSGAVQIAGNTVIGNTATDTVSVLGNFTSNLIPSVNNTYSLGTQLRNWAAVSANVVNTDTIRSYDEVVKFSNTGAIKLPSANTALRPVGPAGMLRFNTDENRFEGWDGTLWSGLAGSVIDLDRNTFIIAETFAGADNNELDFVTSNVQRMQIGASGNLLFGSDLNKLVIDFATGNVFVNGKLTANTNLILDPVGYISAANNTIADVADPVNSQDVVTLNYLNNELNAGLTIVDNANTYSEAIDLLQSPTIEIGRGLELQTLSSANNSFKIGLDAPMTGSTGIYGNDGFIPRIRITEDGRIDFATEIAVELQANAIPDFTETSRDIIGLMFTDGIHEGVSVFNDDPNDRMNILANNFGITLSGDLTGTAQVTRLSNTSINATITTNYVGNVAAIANSGIIVTHTPSVNSTASVGLDLNYLNSVYVPATGGTFTGNISAPRFVDSNNTNFYMDPNGTSRINDIEVGFGGNFSQIKMRDGPGSFSTLYGQGGRVGFLNNTFNFAAYSERSTGNWVVDGGDVRAKRFVDVDATTYFVHPGGTDTYLRQITVQDKISVSSIAIGGDVGVRTIRTTAGILTLDGSGGINLLGAGADLNVNSSKIINLLNPTAGQDAATKSYVDAAAQGLRVIPAALAATTTNLNATFVSGVLTSNDNGAFTVDDVVAFVVGSRVLVKNQNAAAQNGSYAVTAVGSVSTPWVLTRGEYFNESSEIPGAFQFVTDGTLNRSTGWVATVADAETFTIGTDDVIWYQFSGAGTYTAGEALTLNGTEFSISDGDIQNIKLANPSISIAGEAGANTVIALGDTLIIEGTNGVDTTISNGKVSIAVNVLDGGTF